MIEVKNLHAKVGEKKCLTLPNFKACKLVKYAPSNRKESLFSVASLKNLPYSAFTVKYPQLIKLPTAAEIPAYGVILVFLFIKPDVIPNDFP